MLEKFDYKDRVATLTLKDGLKWSDGTPLTIDEVISNYYCLVPINTMWYYVDKLEKLDEHTLQITFCVDSDLVQNLALNSPVMAPSSQYGKFGEQFKELMKS